MKMKKKRMIFVQDRIESSVDSDMSNMDSIERCCTGEFLSAITKLALRLELYPRATTAIRDEIEKYLEVREMEL